jgi:hypothetical protein
MYLNSLLTHLMVLIWVMMNNNNPEKKMHYTWCNTESCCWTIMFTWVTSGSNSLSTARVRISRLFGSHLNLMLAVSIVDIFSQMLELIKNKCKQSRQDTTVDCCPALSSETRARKGQKPTQMSWNHTTKKHPCHNKSRLWIYTKMGSCTWVENVPSKTSGGQKKEKKLTTSKSGYFKH